MPTMPISPIFTPCSDPAFGKMDELVLESRQNFFVQPGVLLGQEEPAPALKDLSIIALDEPLKSDGGHTLDESQVIFNLTNIIVGVGVLSVPYALKQSGYSALVIIGMVICITSKTGRWIGASVDMAAKSEEAAALPSSAWDFGFLAQLCGGPRLRVCINVVTVLEIWFALVTFMAMNGGNAALVWHGARPELTVPLTGALATAAIFVPPRIFSYLSLVSTLAMLVAAIAMVSSTIMLSHWAHPYRHLGVAALVQPGNIPRSVGIIMFCFAGHPCFPQVRTSMKSPSRWGFCIQRSFLLAFLYYFSFGYLGYIVFGTDLSQSVADNLAHVKGAQRCQIVAAFCFLIKVQLTVPMLMNAIVVSIWAPSAGARQWPPLRVLLVFTIAAFTILVALACADKVAIVASLAGNLLVMVTSVLFPTYVHMTLSRREQQQWTWKAIREYGCVIIFGTVMAIIGTALAVHDMLYK